MQCPLPGLMLTADGPRTDLADITTYVYRMADDPATPKTYRKGDLWKVTDALGHVTEFVGYDENGRALRIKDANNVITDMTYHPRGWLLSRSVRAAADGAASAADANTSMTYDAAGNLTRVTQADGTYLNYRYDSAYRLTGITNPAGHHVDYTLDALGHRTGEQTYDVSDAVTPTRLLTRSYTTLVRLDRQIDAFARAWQLGYDGNGNTTDQTDPLGILNRAYS